ncbi:MAG: DUF58 domain-containing protein [Steroidobacteraceae bacterium]
MNALRGRVREWALRRQGADTLPLRLAARRIYIVPTPAGWTFALLIGVMFIAGINYGNGLALLFTFWLTGFALVGMVQTQRTLAGLQLRGVTAMPGFAGETVSLALSVAGRTALGDLQLADSTAASPPSDETSREGALTIALPARRRGPWRAPPLRLTCTAPFGLFRTWTWLQLDCDTVVYPHPAGALPVPESPGDDSGGAQAVHGQDELAWLRDFRDGDSPRQVAWKAYARGAPLLVREYQGAAALRREFDFARLPGLDVEARLSQLARWIMEAQARNESWVLQLPEGPAMAGSGAAHRDDCLRRLALHGLRGGGR